MLYDVQIKRLLRQPLFDPKETCHLSLRAADLIDDERLGIFPGTSHHNFLANGGPKKRSGYFMISADQALGQIGSVLCDRDRYRFPWVSGAVKRHHIPDFDRQIRLIFIKEKPTVSSAFLCVGQRRHDLACCR